MLFAFIFSYLSQQLAMSSHLFSMMFWIINLSAAFLSMDKIFSEEVSYNNLKLLLFYFSAEKIIIAKLIFNFILMLGIEFVSFITLLFLINPKITLNYQIPVILILTASSFSIGLILTAIISSAGKSKTLFTIISFPIILPILIISSRLTSSITSNGSLNSKNILFFIFYDIFFFTLSLLLGKILLKEEL